MPRTVVRFYKDENGVPVLDWLLQLTQKNQRAAKKCLALIELLKQFGSELRRPSSDYLRDGVYELRTKVGTVNYRILYGFVGKDIAVLANSFTKEKVVPAQQIERAIERLNKYKQNPQRHRHDEE